VKHESYPHKIAAVYPDKTAAEAALNAFNLVRLGGIRITLLAPGAGEVDLAIEPEIEETRNTVVEDTLAGGAAGTATGAAVAGATAMLAPALFVSAPVVGPLIILGYGAIIGSTAGAIRGLRVRETLLAGLFRDALDAGYRVILVHAQTEEARLRAQVVIDETMAEETACT